MDFEEFLENDAGQIMNDFLVDNKEYDRMCREIYKQYLKN